MIFKAVRFTAAARRLATGVAAAVLLTVPAAAQEQQQPQSVTVDSVVVEGAVREAPAEIQIIAGLHPGDAVGYREIQRALRRLWATGQFADVRIEARAGEGPLGGGVILVIAVEEQPIVSQIVMRGLEHVDGDQVRDTVGLRSGEPLDPARIAEAETMIRDQLAQEGFAARSIEHTIEPLADRPNEVRLVFDIDEGTRVAIAEIDFVGNATFSEDQLLDVMSTGEEGFLWFRSGTYDPLILRSDLRQALPDFYGSWGFIDFAVTNDTLIVDQASGKARLVITVDEGPQYVLSDFEIQGNRRFPSEELRRYFDPARGGLLGTLGLGRAARSVNGRPVFDATAFRAATAEVRRLYSNTGYLYAQVEPAVQRTQIEGQPAVEVAWIVREGEPAYIAQVSIVGNTVTHEQVIRDRIVMLPGDVYSEDRLIQSYRSVSALGFFQTPMPLPRMEPTEDGDVNITFEVQERQTGSVNFGTAIGGGTIGIAGFLGYDQPNLFGKAKSGHLRWEFGRWSNNFEARYADPAIFDSRWSGSVSLFSARDRFFSFGEGERRRTGVGLRVGYPFPLDPRWTRFYVGYSIAETSYEEAAGQTGTIFNQPDALQSTFSSGLVRTTLDHPIFPTVGSRQSFDMEFNGGPLGGDGDFQKYQASSSWFVPVGSLGGDQPGARPVRFTLGLSADLGMLMGDPARFPFERFWMGGVQFGRPLRGYDETTVTPEGYIDRNAPGVALTSRFGDAYMRLSGEFAMRFNDNLSLGVFYDAGNVWHEPSQIDPTRLFRGAGVGLMLVTPFGPVGLDYAYGFDRDVPGWQLHFKFGQMF
ncbi:MAG TPA: outer membrane protein assembly factor BamA [Longimicrobiales bacterium]|nr:outer membrane protein assembly factor BamA [Longimicrobiales bacterium]